MFEGEALLARLQKLGLLEEEKRQLDYVLNLQTEVYQNGMSKSLHHARVMVRQGHICVGGRKVNVPSFMVRVDSARFVEISNQSPLGGGRPGRVARKKAKS